MDTDGSDVTAAAEVSVEDFAVQAREWLERHSADAPRDYGAILPPDLASVGRMSQAVLFEAEFDEVRIPTGNLLGPENEGWMVGMSALMNERGYIGAAGISLKRRLDSMLALGGALDAHQRQQLVGLWARGTALWAMGQRRGRRTWLLGLPKEPNARGQPRADPWLTQRFSPTQAPF